MIVLHQGRYRVFGNHTFSGNPVSLFELDTLDDSDAILEESARSWTEDNVFFTAVDGKPVMARFFSTKAELLLCGHGLLALAHHVRERDVNGEREVHSPYGSWRIYGDSHGPGVLMPTLQGLEIVDSNHWMKRALRGIGMKHEKLHLCPNGVWVVLLREMTDLLSIDAETVASLPCGSTTPGAIIAALPLSDGRYGYRYFAPWHGKMEDSGTGSAHCYLAPLLASSPTPVTALQFSPQGMAEMRIRLRDGAVALAGRVDPIH